MPSQALTKLIEGFKEFKEKFFQSGDPTYERLARGQGPKTLVIGCSDSRVDPAIIASASPGDLFVVRNVANLVPPCETGGGLHGVSAAIEFAVVSLQVENVIVLGHRQCGGIRALLFPEDNCGQFVAQWVKIAEPAKKRALAAGLGDDQAALWHRCELESIRTSVENLRTFPFVREAEQKRGMAILGIYFDIEKGELMEYDQQAEKFHTLPI